MEPSSSLLGFEEEAKVSSSSARRLVPWLNWHEWLFVKHALFSDSPHSALKRISAWRSRASLPVLIEVTASIIEIQLKDPCFRQDESNDASLSEEMLAMLYCMAIMRLVNGVIEKTRKKEVASIAVAADAIGIPRMLIDIRHEGSHRELPSLKIVRSASIKALDWLKSYYWEPQSKAIPFQGEGLGEVKKEIKSKIRELAICLKVNGSAQSSSSLLKGKRVKHGELLFGRNKLLSLMVGKSQMSRTGGPKKQISKILKYVLRLYSSFSSEIVSVLLEYLLKALSSSELEGNADDASNGLTTQNVLADWKLILLKLCNKEPEILLNLLKEVLDMIETRENMKYAEDNPNIGISHSRPEIQQRDYLSSLFAWLVGILSKVPSAAANMPKRVLHELLRKCLLISRLCNKQLVDSALQLAELMNDSYLKEKVRKFSLISLSNLDSADDQSSLLTSKNILKFEESILEATKKLELVKQQIMKNKKPTAMDCDTKKSQTWTLAKSWNPCPIGMLPRTVGSSGYLPVLNVIDDEKQNQLLESKENWKLIPHGNKRDATLDLPQLDNSTVKKMRKTKEFSESNNELPMQVVKGCLLVGGVLKKLTEEELLAIESSVRILV
ncbi:pre-rRNA-processing protein las1 isoform X2 [Cajanus cajan]|uniref:LAS1-like protein n=1 Tax=Cajanus cajan TaxID=3821 RepID=A0A151U1Y2_CAJCA|nr:pre-rRNA-processing protein las1 isoform X2 [Cajanus cajan]KYP73238.1 LAS1-like protein [Cajanus cajan]